MKALLLKQYGDPEKVLAIQNVDKPTPKEGEILVKIFTTTINDYDWGLISGRPYLYRLMYGLLKPRNQIPGMELSGIVEEVGPNVKNFIIGDAVFGDTSNFGFGTLAEYICIDEKALRKKPDYLSYEEAASIPHAFALASQALRKLGKIEKGHKVLINGGGGGVGTLGLQIAKSYDCEVTGVDSRDKFEMMKSVGFDKVIDYKTTNITRKGDQYDLILDCHSNRFALTYLRILKPNGRYISIGGNITSLLGVFIWGKIISVFSSKIIKLLILDPNKDLDYFIELYNQHKIKPQIDGPYLLEDCPKLIRYFGEGKHKGKIVVKIQEG